MRITNLQIHLAAVISIAATARSAVVMAPPILDLSQPYVKSSTYPTPEGQELIEIAKNEEDIYAFVALECGKVVAEYGNVETDIRHLFSVTKSWSGLLLGVMEKEGLISLDETLGDVFTDEEVWADVEDAEERKQVTIEETVQMRGGFFMPE